MSIRAKIVGCFLGVITLFLSITLYSYSKSKQANQRLVLVNELFLPLSRLVTQLQTYSHGMGEDVRRYFFNPNPQSPSSAISRVARDLYPYVVQKRLSSIETVLNREESGLSKATVTEMLEMVTGIRISFESLGNVTERSQFESQFEELKKKLTAFSKRVDDECQKVTLAVQSEGTETIIQNLIVSMLAIGCGILSVILSARALTPLPALIESIKKIADGNFDQSLKVQTTDKDEVATLAREYNRMLAALKDRDKKILDQQKDLLQSERLAAVGQLSAEIVHEIRNPLNSLSLNIDWLESEVRTAPPEVLKTLKSLSREIQRLNNITESYLVRARVPSQASKKTAVNELIREILNFDREEDKKRKIEVTASLSNQEIFVKTDRSKLRQAFLNVLRNAREAMPRGGKLSIRTEVKDNVYRIEVADTGYGMNESTRRNSFQPFFTTKPNGTGLGMMLTKNIVEEAHGTISCNSEIGHGTKFTFQFPV